MNRRLNLQELPEGTRVRVTTRIHQTDPTYRAETTGVIEGWGDESTGAWFAHDRHGKLQLKRLRLRKADGEVSTLVVDDLTRMERIGPDAVIDRQSPAPSTRKADAD